MVRKCRIITEEDQEQHPADTNTLQVERGHKTARDWEEAMEPGGGGGCEVGGWEHCHLDVQGGNGPLTDSTRNSE